MRRISIRPFARTVRNRCFLVLALAVGACAYAPDLGGFDLTSYAKDDDAPVPTYSRGRLDQLWAAAPDALVMVQRAAGDERVQLLGLENATAMEGDNFLWLRAHGDRGSRFDLDRLVSDVGGVPTPFTSLSNADLRSGEDSLGAYFWKEWRSGSQTNCVVAFRRLDSGARTLPSGARSLEAFLRNCVVGSTDEALQPILDNRISHSVIAGSTVSGGGNRSLSPLAGPRRP